MANKTLAVKVDADVRGADKIRGLGGNLASAGVELAKFAAVAGAAFVAVGAFTSRFASDLNESLSKTNVVFGDNAAAIIAWSETAAEAMGISQQQALESASTFGNLFSAMEIGPDVSQDMSTELVQLASDLASFNNLDPTEVLDKLRAGIVGEAEPLRTLGVNISAARTEAKALELGLWDGVGALSASAKAQANYALILEDTALAQGDFARTSDGMANQQRTLGAVFEDTMAGIGQAFVPLIESMLPQITAGLQSFGGWVTENMPTIQAVIKTVLDAIGAAFSFLTTTALPNTINVFSWLATNVIPLLVSAFDWVITNVIPPLVAAFQTVATWVSANWPVISSVITQAFGAISAVVQAVWPVLESLATVLFPVIGAAATVLFNVINAAFKLIGGVFNVAARAWKVIGDRIFKPLGDGFKAAINVIKGIWNAFVGFWNGIQITVPEINLGPLGTHGGFTIGLPDLPRLAEGGVVTEPTLGLFGEAGPEAVIPLDKLDDLRGGDITVNINAPTQPMTPRDIGRELRRTGVFGVVS